MQSQFDVFDSQSFAVAVKERRDNLSQSLVTTASEIGVGTATLSRVERAMKLPDLPTYARICKWLGVPLDRFIKVP